MCGWEMRVIVYDENKQKATYFIDVPNSTMIGLTNQDINLFCHNYSSCKFKEIDDTNSYITKLLNLTFDYKVGQLTDVQRDEIRSQIWNIYSENDVKLDDYDPTDHILRAMWSCQYCLRRN